MKNLCVWGCGSPVKLVHLGVCANCASWYYRTRKWSKPHLERYIERVRRTKRRLASRGVSL